MTQRCSSLSIWKCSPVNRWTTLCQKKKHRLTVCVSSHRSREKWWLLQVLISPCTSIAAANRSRFDRMVGQKGKDGSLLTFFQELVKFAALSGWISIWSHKQILTQLQVYLTNTRMAPFSCCTGLQINIVWLKHSTLTLHNECVMKGILTLEWLHSFYSFFALLFEGFYHTNQLLLSLRPAPL